MRVAPNLPLGNDEYNAATKKAISEKVEVCGVCEGQSKVRKIISKDPRLKSHEKHAKKVVSFKAGRDRLVSVVI